MKLGFDEVGLIFADARTLYPRSMMLAVTEARIILGERLMSYESVSPELASLLKRVNEMMAFAATVPVPEDANMLLTDLAPRMLDMAATLRDVLHYIDTNWDTLSHSENIQNSDRERVRSDRAYLDSEIARLRQVFADEGAILFRSLWMKVMNDIGLKFIAVTLGRDRMEQWVTEMNVLLEHLRVQIKITQLGEGIGTSPKTGKDN